MSNCALSTWMEFITGWMKVWGNHQVPQGRKNHLTRYLWNPVLFKINHNEAVRFYLGLWLTHQHCRFESGRSREIEWMARRGNIKYPTLNRLSAPNGHLPMPTGRQTDLLTLGYFADLHIFLHVSKGSVTRAGNIVRTTRRDVDVTTLLDVSPSLTKPHSTTVRIEHVTSEAKASTLPRPAFRWKI